MKKLFAILTLLVLIIACRKDSFITGSNAVLETSEDSLHFDTLFTSTGSVTYFFKVYNRNDQQLRISEISLAGGNASYFRINADGFEGPVVRDLEMKANDSLYVFVTTRIEPNNDVFPFVVEDSVRIRYNGKESRVQLQAWGQNANFLRNAVISTSIRWTSEKPYVILGGLLVAEGAVLQIDAGARIYCHADAPLLVDGRLEAIGENPDSLRIVFQGDRLDYPYRDFPGAWPGIYLRESSTANLLRHVIVKNAYQGIVSVGAATGGGPKLRLEQSVINNCYDAGLLGVATGIVAENVLISNCGKNMQLVRGGDYAFTHCTSVAFSNSYLRHEQPVLSIANFTGQGTDLQTASLRASFVNCIFWGENGVVDNEVVTARQGSDPFAVSLVNCLTKWTKPPGEVEQAGMVLNKDPLFRTVDTQEDVYDFRLQAGSPAENSGVSTALTSDLDSNNRNVTAPDIGCYETF